MGWGYEVKNNVYMYCYKVCYTFGIIHHSIIDYDNVPCHDVCVDKWHVCCPYVNSIIIIIIISVLGILKASLSATLGSPPKVTDNNTVAGDLDNTAHSCLPSSL